MSSFIAPALMEDPALLKHNRSRSFVEYREKTSSMQQEKKTASDESILNRVRRDHSMIIRAEKLIDKDGKKTNIVSMVKLISSFSIDQILTLSNSILGLQQKNRQVYQHQVQDLQSTAKDWSIHSREVATLEFNFDHGLPTRRSRKDLLVSATENSSNVRNSPKHGRRCHDSWNARLSWASWSSAGDIDSLVDHHRGHHCWAVPSCVVRVYTLEVWILQATKARSNAQR